MGIINRTMDPSQQREVFTETYQGVIAGQSLPLCMVPYPCLLDSVVLASTGAVSAVIRVDIHRFIAGAGITQIVGAGISTIVSAFGTSGVQGVSLVAPGSTLLLLQAGDQVVLTSGISAYVGNLTADVTIKKTQDRVAFFGNSS